MEGHTRRLETWHRKRVTEVESISLELAELFRLRQDLEQLDIYQTVERYRVHMEKSVEERMGLIDLGRSCQGKMIRVPYFSFVNDVSEGGGWAFCYV